MRPRLRLLPVMIFSAACLLSIKVIDIADGLIVHLPTLGIGETLAAADPETGAPAGEAGGTSSQAPLPVTAPVLAETPPYETPPLPLGDRSFEVAGTAAPVYTAEELAVLQSLAERRAELDALAQTLEARERQLGVAETRIDQKIAELAALQAQIEALLQQYDAQEEERLMSLVKIYETMKPKDAAPIFNTLDMDILLEIISRMSNIRSAPILAQMDPIRAQQVTEELARRMRQRPAFMEQAAAAQ